MLSTMTQSRQALSWACGSESDIQPRWLKELQSQESLRQIDRATKYVHIRRGSRTWSTVLQQIDDPDSYKLNYVEVEIGPPKPGRDGAERGPFIKLADSSSEVNYSTIVFPDRETKADGSENRNSVGNGTSKSHSKLERKNSKKHAAKQAQKQQKILHQQQSTQDQESLYSEPPTEPYQEKKDEESEIRSPSSSPKSRRPRALSTPTSNRKFPSEAELADAIKARQERKDQEPSSSAVPPKTRTLPTRDKLWLEEDLQVQEPVIMSKKSEQRLMKEHSHDSGILSKKSADLSAMRAMQKVRRKSSGEGYPYDFSNMKENSLSITKSSSFGPKDMSISSYQLQQEPCTEIVVDNSKQSKPPVLKKTKSELEKAIARRHKKGSKDGDLRLGSSTDNSPCGSEASSPEPKSAKEKLRFNFPFFKSKSRGSPDGQSVKSSSSSVALETAAKLAAAREQEESKKQQQAHGRKPVPLPRGQGRESSIESLPDMPISPISPISPKFIERPIPSPPLQQQASIIQQQITQPSHAWIDSPSFHRQADDEMYMNVAFSKPNKLQSASTTQQSTASMSSQHVTHSPHQSGASSQHVAHSPHQSGASAQHVAHSPHQSGASSQHVAHSPHQSGASSPCHPEQQLHRYENVFLEERMERLSGSQERPSSTESPRGSVDISMHRPVPAPRHYGSMGGHANESITMTTTTAPSHSHPGHCRKESWGNAATFASHGISPSSHHRVSPKHESPSGSPHQSEMSSQLKTSIAHSLAAVHNSHMAQMGHDRSMSTGHVNESGNMKSKGLYGGGGGGLQSRSSGSLDNHGSTSNRGNPAESSNRGNRGHRGSNASLGAAGSIDVTGMNLLTKVSQERLNFASQVWYYGRMLRQECEYLMLSQGQSCQYLVRDSSHRVGDLMLSVLYGTKVHHYVIQTTQEGKFQIAHHDFNSVEDIIEFYHHHVIMYSPTQEPVYLRDPFILSH